MKVILTNPAAAMSDASFDAQATANNAALTAAIENTLSRDGTAPNQMQAPLDMNSKRILNLPFPGSGQEPVRLQDVGLGLVLAGSMARANNLSDVMDMAQAKANLGFTKADVGLTNVDNTSDVNKPVSTAQAAADAAVKAGLVKGDVGLGNVDNTSDVNKPVSTATSTAISNSQAASLSAASAMDSVTATRATAAATYFSAGTSVVITGGYTAVGDGGGATYKRGAGPGSFTSNGGAVTWVPTFDGPVCAKIFGVVGDGVTDDTVALQTAVSAAAGGTLVVRGICGVSGQINLPSNISILGNNNRLDGFKVLGAASLRFGIFYALNRSNVILRNLRFTGNLVEPAAYSTGALVIDMDQTSTGDIVNYEVSKCYFENFKTTEWIWIVADAQVGNTNSIREIKIFKNEIYALASCATTNAISSNNGNTFVRVTGNTLTGAGALGFGLLPGSVSNIVFTENTCYGPGLSGMFMAFANTRDMVVSNNITRSMGNNTLSADVAYTYSFYNSNTGVYADPTNITCNGNVGYGNHSFAIYFAGCTNVTASGNSFAFTYPSGIEPTLPHGSAISLNGCLRGSVTGNTLTDSLGGVSVVGITERAGTVTISGNVIHSSTNSSLTQTAYGILLSGWSNNVQSLTNVVGNSITMTGTNASGITIGGGADHHGNLKISDNMINVVNAAVVFESAPSVSMTVSVSDNYYVGPAAGLGFAKPTWSGLAGDVVQNFAPAELGTAGSKYVVKNWICLGTTTWQDQRMLTGN